MKGRTDQSPPNYRWDGIDATTAAYTCERRHAVDCDLKAFFDTVNHDRLMEGLRQKVKDRRVLALIRRYLNAVVVLLDGRLEATPPGVPQGGPL